MKQDQKRVSKSLGAWECLRAFLCNDSDHPFLVAIVTNKSGRCLLVTEDIRSSLYFCFTEYHIAGTVVWYPALSHYSGNAMQVYIFSSSWLYQSYFVRRRSFVVVNFSHVRHILWKFWPNLICMTHRIDKGFQSCTIKGLCPLGAPQVGKTGKSILLQNYNA